MAGRRLRRRAPAGQLVAPRAHQGPHRPGLPGHDPRGGGRRRPPRHLVGDRHAPGRLGQVRGQPARGRRARRGSKPGIGWDGAPQWATITDGADTCAAGRRARAGTGGDARLRPLLRRHRRHPDRAGQDLGARWPSRSPATRRWPATTCSTNPTGAPTWPRSGAKLGAFYQRAVAAIRQAEQAGRRLLPHRVLRAGGGVPVGRHPAAGRRRDRPEPGVRPAQLPRLDRSGHRRAGLRRGPGRRPVLRDDDVDRRVRLVRHRRGGHRRGDRLRQRPGHGHGRAAPGGSGARPAAIRTRWASATASPPARSSSSTSTAARATRTWGRCPQWSPILSRAYPRSAPGRLTSLRSDGVAGTMSLSGDATDASAGARLVVWVPGTGAQPKLGGQGIQHVDLDQGDRAAGWCRPACATAATRWPSGAGAPVGGGHLRGHRRRRQPGYALVRRRYARRHPPGWRNWQAQRA